MPARGSSHALRALPAGPNGRCGHGPCCQAVAPDGEDRSEEHTSELQSQSNLVCRLLLEKKKKTQPASKQSSAAPRRTLSSGSNRSVTPRWRLRGCGLIRTPSSTQILLRRYLTQKCGDTC